MEQDEFSMTRSEAIASLLPMVAGLTITAQVLVVFMELAYGKGYNHGLSDAQRIIARRPSRTFDAEVLS